MTLLEKCNADVFKAILDIKAERPVVGEKIISILQSHQYAWQVPIGDTLYFAAHLPSQIWDLKVHTFQFLFVSQQTTPIQ